VVIASKCWRKPSVTPKLARMHLRTLFIAGAAGYFSVEDHSDYPRPTDDFECVDAGEYVAIVRTIIAPLLAADSQTLPQRNDTP
jgi:hypothetical protein